jgi:hypothetical protein
MNLSTARSEKRAREVGIRKTVGALRGSLIWQFLGESVLIAAIAGVFAIVVVQLSMSGFNQLTQKQLYVPYANPYFWLIALGFIIITGIISGSYPALYLSSFKPVAVLKGTFKAANALVTPRKLLVVIQFTFAVVLIICTIIIRQQLQYAQDRDTGYKKDNLVYSFMSGEIAKHYSAIRNELLSSGAATSVSKTNSPITQRYSDSWGFNWPGSLPKNKVDFIIYSSDGSLVKTMGLKLVAGRDIDPVNYPTDSTAMLVNEASVKIMNLKDPVGQSISQGEGKDIKTWHIVGVSTCSSRGQAPGSTSSITSSTTPIPQKKTCAVPKRYLRNITRNTPLSIVLSIRSTPKSLVTNKGSGRWPACLPA